MTTRKSGLLGLMMLGMSVLAACESKAGDVIVTPPTDTTRIITLSLVPATATLTAVGQTVTLVAIVSGTTIQTATFSSSNTSVATVGGSTGVVTAVANGTAVITAVSTADARARAGSVITVSIGVVVPPANPTISVQKITVAGNTNAPVNTSNTMGQIDVTLNMEVPVNSPAISRVEWVVDNTVVVCTQSFGQTGEIEVDASAVELVCSVDTAQLDGTGAPRFANGPHAISARVILGNASVITATNSTTLIFNNQSFITARLDWLATGTTTPKACVTAGSNARSLGGTGSLWCGGDLRVTLTPVIFGTANDRLASVTVAITTSGAGASGLTACRTSLSRSTDPTIAVADGGIGPALVDPDGALGPLLATQFPGCGSITLTQTDATAADGLSVLWSAGSNPTTGINNIEDIISSITVNGVTVGGQAGPNCINPDPARNPLSTGTTFVCGTGVTPGSFPNVAFFPTVVRLDNTAPRATLFDLTPARCSTASCFVTSSFSFAPRAGTSTTTGFFSSVDYGVDSQDANTTFSAGASSTTLVTVTTGADLPETVVASELLVRANLADGLGNLRQIYATPLGANPVPDAAPSFFNSVFQTSSTGAQRIGADKTAPEFDAALSTFPANNGANDGLAFSFSYRDSGIGPSGFGLTPVWVKVEQITTSGTGCRDPETGASLGSSSCSQGVESNGFVATDGSFNIGNTTTQGYYRVSYFLEDAAGNRTATTVVTTLIDAGNVTNPSPPTAGGIVAPSVLTGNSSATFSSSVTDNLDLGDVTPYFTYDADGSAGAGAPLLHLQEAGSTVGTYGSDALTTSGTATTTTPNFIRSVQNGLAGAIHRASDVVFLVRDVAGVVDSDPCPPVGALNGTTTLATSPPAVGTIGNCVLRRDDIQNAVVAGITSSNPETLFGAPMTSYGVTVNNATVCNSTGTGVGQPCPTNPTSTVASITATGPSATFGNPFQRVNLYYVNLTTLRSILIGTVTAPSVTDTGAPPVRTFTWQVTWNPANLPAGAYTLQAVGVSSTGMGLLASTAVVVAVD